VACPASRRHHQLQAAAVNGGMPSPPVSISTRRERVTRKLGLVTRTLRRSLIFTGRGRAIPDMARSRPGGLALDRETCRHRGTNEKRLPSRTAVVSLRLVSIEPPPTAVFVNGQRSKRTTILVAPGLSLHPPKRLEAPASSGRIVSTAGPAAKLPRGTSRSHGPPALVANSATPSAKDALTDEPAAGMDQARSLGLRTDRLQLCTGRSRQDQPSGQSRSHHLRSTRVSCGGAKD
jgi:hypothetical protein